MSYVHTGRTIEGKYFAQIRTTQNGRTVTHYETAEYLTKGMADADAKCWKEFHMTDETPLTYDIVSDALIGTVRVETRKIDRNHSITLKYRVKGIEYHNGRNGKSVAVWGRCIEDKNQEGHPNATWFDAYCSEIFYAEKAKEVSQDYSIDESDTVVTDRHRNGQPVKSYTGRMFADRLTTLMGQYPKLTFQCGSKYNNRELTGGDFFLVLKSSPQAKGVVYRVRKGATAQQGGSE